MRILNIGIILHTKFNKGFSPEISKQLYEQVIVWCQKCVSNKHNLDTDCVNDDYSFDDVIPEIQN